MKKSRVLSVMGPKGEKTAGFIVRHAAWQKSRGRNSSESYNGVRNPVMALKLATKEILSTRYDSMGALDYDGFQPKPNDRYWVLKDGKEFVVRLNGLRA